MKEIQLLSFFSETRGFGQNKIFDVDSVDLVKEINLALRI
jgi:hypothetical protein